MLMTLLILIALAAVLHGVMVLARSLGDRIARGKGFRALSRSEQLPPDIRQAADRIILDRTDRRLARRARRHGQADPAYAELRTKPKPKFSSEQLRALKAIRRDARAEYLEHANPGPYHYVIIFMVASVLGLGLEMVWMFFTAGLTELRVGLVWGPFSPLYGFGAVMLTMALWSFRSASTVQVFLVSAVLGGALEQTTGMLMENLFHAQSWTYAYLPDHITQWVAWRFLFMWGLVGLVWCRVVMPEVVYRIGDPTTRVQVVLVGVLTAFLIVDMLATVFCFYRKAQRDAGIPASNAIERYVDERFSDQFIENRFQNLVIGRDL